MQKITEERNSQNINSSSMKNSVNDSYTKIFDENSLLKGNIKYLQKCTRCCFVLPKGYEEWLKSHDIDILVKNCFVYDSELERLLNLRSNIKRIIIISPYEKCISKQIEKIIINQINFPNIYCFIRDILFIRKVFSTMNIEKIVPGIKLSNQLEKFDLTSLKKCLVFTLPRSGSTFFTDTFGQSNLFGMPKEHIQDEIVALINQGFISLEEYIKFVFVNSATSNNTVMTKIIDGWFLNIYNHSTNEEKDWIKELLMNSKIVYLERNNKIKQAISAYKSRNSKVFHSTDKGADSVELEYNFEKIFWFYKNYVKKEKVLKLFLDDLGINYLYVTYEDFAKDTEKYFKEVASYLGVEIKETDYKPSIYKKISNKNSDSLYKSFLLDLENS